VLPSSRLWTPPTLLLLDTLYRLPGALLVNEADHLFPPITELKNAWGVTCAVTVRHYLVMPKGSSFSITVSLIGFST